MSEFDEARATRSYWIEVILLSVASAMGYLVIPLIGSLLFLVPLQVLLVRRGITAFGYGAAEVRSNPRRAVKPQSVWNVFLYHQHR